MKRRRERASYECEVIRSILDTALICNVAFVADSGHPVVLPTIHGRIDDTLYVHGSVVSHMLRTIGAGAECCVNATVVDGLVLARSAFHHTMNYRSVVVYGTPRVVTDDDEKVEGMRAMSERITPGRWDDVRAPSSKELAQTMVLALPLDEASAKVRTGPPADDDDDLATATCWAGVLPLHLARGAPVADDPTGDAPLPAYLTP